MIKREYKNTKHMLNPSHLVVQKENEYKKKKTPIRERIRDWIHKKINFEYNFIMY